MASTTPEWPVLGSPSAFQGEFAPVLAEAGKGNFEPLVQALAQTRGRWDVRIFLVECISLDRVPEAALTAWYGPRAGQYEAELIFGAGNLSWAEAARKPAATMPGSDAEATYKAKLATAEACFLRAFPLDAADPTAGVFLLRASTPLRRPQDALGRVFTGTNQRDPGNIALHLAYLDSLTARWTGDGGDPGAALAWARQISSQCPPGLELHMLVVQAYVRRWEDSFFGGSAARITGDADRAAGVVTPAARAEVVAACERSIHHPSYVPQRSKLYLSNLAAYWFYLAVDRPRLTVELQQIGAAYTPEPWATRAGGDARRGYSRAIDTARGRGVAGALLLVGGPKNALRIAGALAAAIVVFAAGDFLVNRPAKIGQACKFDADCSSAMCLGPVGNGYCSHDCGSNGDCSNASGSTAYACTQGRETLHPTGQKPVDAIVHACVPQP
jgi:hypothetical protein